MKNQTILKLTMLVAIAFGMQTTASAQLGGLVKKAKQAAGKVNVKVDNGNQATTTTTTTTTTQSSQSDNPFNDPEYVKAERQKTSWSREEDAVKEAGGMQNFLELNTPDGAVLWKYYNVDFAQASETKYLYIGQQYAKPLVEMLRFMKGNKRRSVPQDSKAFFDREQPSREKDFTDKIMTKGKPMPDSDIKALKRECARIRALWEALPEEQRRNRMQ